MVQTAISIPDRAIDLLNSTMPFNDGRVITLRMDDALIYLDEVNTSLLTENFDMEVFEVEADQIAIHASGSVILSTNPSATNTLILSNNGVSKTFTFAASPSSATDVGIGGSLYQSLDNLKARINHADNASLKLTATHGTAVVPDRQLLLTNQYVGAVGNSSPSVQISGAFNPTTQPENIYGQFSGGKDLKESLRRLEFPQDVPQVVDGYMVSETPPRRYGGPATTSSVEYFFNVMVDGDVDVDAACKGAEIYNKQSYYIDLDFDCSQVALEDERVLYDIYGPVTEPVICQD